MPAGTAETDAPERPPHIADGHHRTTPSNNPTVFTFGKVLGTGSFATVVIAVDKATQAKFAMKVIEKAKCAGREELIVKEVSLLTKLRHKNVVRLHDCFQSKDKVYLQMEYLEGGELFDRIVNLGFYSEDHARKVVTNLVSAVGYLHDQNIVHRDLKPENLLLVSTRLEEIEIKLADFGFSTMAAGNDVLRTNCGTLMYMAPEIIKGETYGKAVDMWSVGVITYVMCVLSFSLSRLLPPASARSGILYLQCTAQIISRRSAPLKVKPRAASAATRPSGTRMRAHRQGRTLL
jgi:serine/threonine protein kinase